MRVAIRTDSSTRIGSGHLMRCLTLAEQLRTRGAEILFVCRDLPGNLNDLVENRGFELSRMPPPRNDDLELGWNRHAAWLGVHWQLDAEETLVGLEKMKSPIDWLIVDHYALDWRWESHIYLKVLKGMVIDDLVDRQHQFDLLLDPTLGRTELEYRSLVPNHCRMLLEPTYALLRPEFKQYRGRSLNRRQRPGLKRLLISMGGVDPGNIAGRTLDQIAELGLPLEVDLILGRGSVHYQSVCRHAASLVGNVRVHTDVDNMAELMASADLAVGAGGGTSWERCCLGLPTLVTALAENQRANVAALTACGAALPFEIDPSNERLDLGSLLRDLAGQPEVLRRMSDSGAAVCDGRGAERVCAELKGLWRHDD